MPIELFPVPQNEEPYGLRRDAFKLLNSIVEEINRLSYLVDKHDIRLRGFHSEPSEESLNKLIGEQEDGRE
jgi:hypothetical protein